MPPKGFKKYKTTTTVKPPISDSSSFLIIVESPSKCKYIESFLGSQYTCVATNGHLREIENLKSIQIQGNTVQIQYKNLSHQEKHIKSLKSTISKFQKENIYLATDADREGEAIAWHICDLFDLPVNTTHRILFKEITEVAIRNAVKNPTTISLPLVYSQQTRQVADLLIGYKISPFLWKFINKNGLSAGRCQIPALRLIYDKSKLPPPAIELQPKITGYFLPDFIEFTYHTSTEPLIVSDFLNESILFNHTLSISAVKRHIETPPLPFTTSTLLQTASNVLGYSPKKTMQQCQQLYQQGYITYMRTDCAFYSNTFLNQMDTFLQSEYQQSIDMKWKYMPPSTTGLEAHEAIRPTNVRYTHHTDPTTSSLYHLIWKHSIESCMMSAEYDTTTLHITGPCDGEYTHTIYIPTQIGWKAVTNSNWKTRMDKDLGVLLYCKSLVYTSIRPHSIESIIEPKQTKSNYYTEASLIKELDEYGIGRPATYESILDVIQERGYVKKKDIAGKPYECEEYRMVFSAYSDEPVLTKTVKYKIFGNESNKLVIETIGIAVIDFLVNYFDSLFSYGYTKELQTILDLVASDNKSWTQVCVDCDTFINDISRPLQQLQLESFPISSEYDLVFRKYGPVLIHKSTKEYKRIKPNLIIDMKKVERMEYSPDDLMAVSEKCIGVYQEEPVFLSVSSKDNRMTVEWKEELIPIPIEIRKSAEEIQVSDVIPFIMGRIENPVVLEEESTTSEVYTHKNPAIIRYVNSDISVRKGKWGHYIYYKTDEMKKPAFYDLKSFRGGWKTCEPEELVNYIHKKMAS